MTGKDDYKALISGHKHTRGYNPKDGCTVVFISTANNSEYLEKDVRMVSNEKLPSDAHNIVIKHAIFYPADDELKYIVKKAVDEIKYMGTNLKIIDFDNPAPEDKDYLRKNNITIPAEPDIFVRYINKDQAHLLNESGDAPYPGDCAFPLCVNISKDKDEAWYSTYHEIGHVLGLKHSFEAEENHPEILAGSLDNEDETAMSDTRGKKKTRDFRKLDAIALRHIYGTANNYNGAFERYADSDLGFPSAVYPGKDITQEIYGGAVFKLIPENNVKINEVNIDKKLISYTDKDGHKQVKAAEGTDGNINSYCLPAEGNITISKNTELNFDIDAAGKNSACKLNIGSGVNVNIHGSGLTNNAVMNIDITAGKTRDNYIKTWDMGANNLSLNFTGTEQLSISTDRNGFYIKGDKSGVNINNGALNLHPELLMKVIKINSVPLSELGYELSRDKVGAGIYIEKYPDHLQLVPIKTSEHAEPHTISPFKTENEKLVEDIITNMPGVITITKKRKVSCLRVNGILDLKKPPSFFNPAGRCFWMRS